MQKLAIVIQRYGKDVLGGAETYAQVLATALADSFDVTVLTTTAKNHEDWKIYYKEGETLENNIKILRFNPDFERTSYFHELHRLMLNGTDASNFYSLWREQKTDFKSWANSLPIAFQEELIRSQGPYSSSLLEYIKESEDVFDKFIFVTYLYPTTYFGIQKIRNKSKIFVQTALHDEPIAYLPIWGKYNSTNLLFYTEEEKNIANYLWEINNGQIMGYGIHDNSMNVSKNKSNERYILYAGRIDSGKGVEKLIDYFSQFKKQNPGCNIKLKLIGRNTIGIKSDPQHGIEIIGFVSEDRKLELMSNANAVVLPSPYESLSIVILESFMVSTPVLVNGHCEVLEGHINKSGGGIAYYNYNDFSQALNLILNDEEKCLNLGYNGRKYFLEEYEWSKYQQKLNSIFALTE